MRAPGRRIQLLLPLLLLIASIGFIATGCVQHTHTVSPARNQLRLASTTPERPSSAKYVTVVDMLLGRVPGLQLASRSNDRVAFLLRGGSEILIVIDGVPVTGDAGAALSALSPLDIRNVEVVRNAAAAAVYGARAGDGAILLTTMRRR